MSWSPRPRRAGAFTRLSGDRRNVWSISVSGNWRITFEEKNGAIERLDLEDYH